MAAALQKINVQDLFEAPPPSRDWAALFSVVEDISALVKKIDQFETDTKRWVASMRVRFDKGAEKMRELVRPLPADEVQIIVEPVFEEVFSILDKAVASMEVPIADWDERPELGMKFQSLPVGLRRLFRKMHTKAEAIRIERHDAVVDFYYAMTALRTEIERQDDPPPQAFSSGDDLAAYLRQIA